MLKLAARAVQLVCVSNNATSSELKVEPKDVLRLSSEANKEDGLKPTTLEEPLLFAEKILSNPSLPTSFQLDKFHIIYIANKAMFLCKKGLNGKK